MFERIVCTLYAPDIHDIQQKGTGSLSVKAGAVNNFDESSCGILMKHLYEGRG